MSEFKSGANYKGFSSTAERSGLAYLYGLSDFWAIIFEDSELIDRLLEANTIGLADAYSKFLQLTSSISVNDIQTYLHSEVELLRVKDSGIVESPSGTTYSIPETLVDCLYLLDRPMLAVNTLERNVHYRIDPAASTITFYKPLAELGFPSRVLPTGEVEVAFWATDVVNDDSLISKYFGNLIGVSPKNVTRIYKDFIRGLYFLYTQGPSITALERGLSLALGIPLARTEEEVLLTVRNEVTGNWLVATDKSSYTIPYGVEPEVSAGDTLTIGQELVSIAEVKDYKVEDEWWLNISIPPELLPDLPEVDLLASEDSLTDHLMRDYLKYHTFLVRLKWDNAFTAGSFDEIFRILSDVKPKYTYPIFVWSVVDTEIIPINDDDLNYHIEYTLVDDMGCGGAYIQRYIEKLYERSTSCFTHGNLNPDTEIDNPLSEVTISYKIRADQVLNEISPVPENLLDVDLEPLYNTSESDIRNSFAAAGVDLPADLPRLMLIKDVPIDAASYDEIVIREAVEPGFTGTTFNETLLDFPADTSHHMYQAFVPALGDLNPTEDFFIMELQGNLYSVFLHRPGELPLLDPNFFPRKEEDPLTAIVFDVTVDQFTYDLGSPELTLSNSNFTVAR